MEGIKFCKEKIRYELIDPKCLEELAKVLSYGSLKYQDHNWQKVDELNYHGALMRHFQAIRMGEVIDPESNMLHAAHLFTTAMFLLWFELQRHEDKNKTWDELLKDWNQRKIFENMYKKYKSEYDKAGIKKG